MKENHCSKNQNSDANKIKCLELIFLDELDWMESYRQTYSVPFGIGLPSGLTGNEAVACLARRILKSEPVVIVMQNEEANLQRIQRFKDWLLQP